LFVSYQQLEYCGLTKQTLVQLKDGITSDRHMVELREDKTIELIKPARSRSERAKSRLEREKAAKNGQKYNNRGDSRGQGAKAAPIEIVEID